jgi:predicted peroxiredoxin
MNSNYEIVRELIEYNCGGVDKYIHNNSTWLIFTDDKKWVIELTKDGTLWYNYDFFKNVLKYLSLDVVENQHYITKWVEDTIINGVKETHSGCDLLIDDSIEGVIRNGVKHTEYGDWLDGDERFDDIIQNGVKETKTPGEDGDIMGALDFMSDNNTNNLSHLINDVIEKGIKQTEAAALFDETKVDRIISKGVKETKGGGYLGSIEMKGKIVHQLESPKQNEEVEDVIENGVRNTDWRALPMTRSVEDTIQNGIKETWGYEKQPQKRIDEVIMNGQKD